MPDLVIALLLALAYGFVAAVFCLRLIRNGMVDQHDEALYPLTLLWPIFLGALCFWKAAKFVEFVLPGGK